MITRNTVPHRIYVKPFKHYKSVKMVIWGMQTVSEGSKFKTDHLNVKRDSDQHFSHTDVFHKVYHYKCLLTVAGIQYYLHSINGIFCLFQFIFRMSAVEWNVITTTVELRKYWTLRRTLRTRSFQNNLKKKRSP